MNCRNLNSHKIITAMTIESIISETVGATIGALLATAAAIIVGRYERRASAKASFRITLYGLSSLEKDHDFHAKAHAALLAAAGGVRDYISPEKYGAVKSEIDAFGASDPKEWDRTAHEAFIAGATIKHAGGTRETPSTRFEALINGMVGSL